MDHKAWTDYHHLPALEGSLNLADYKEQFALIPQIHYVGTDDIIIPPSLTQNFALKDKIILVKNATHNSGWEDTYSLIYKQ